MGNVTIDSEMPSNALAHAAHASSLTYSFTNTAGTMLIVAASANASNTQDTNPLTTPAITGVTYNGVAMTKIGTLDRNSVATPQCEETFWYLANPANGANNVVVTASAAYWGLISGALSVTNATIPGNVVSKANDANATTESVAVNGTLASSMIVAYMATGTGYTSTSQTLSASLNFSSHTGGDNAALTRTPGTGGTVTMSDVTSSDVGGMLAMEIFSSSAYVPGPGSALLTGLAGKLGSGLIPGCMIAGT